MTYPFQPLAEHLHKLIPGAGLHVTEVAGLKLQLMQLPAQQQGFSAVQVNAIWQQLPFWAFAWASGQVLALKILQNPHWVKGKRVLDIGTGSGIVALAAARAGAVSVLACDIDPHACQACSENAALNQLEVQTATHWDITSVDVVLAADIFYDQGNQGLLNSLLDTAGLQLYLAESHGLPHYEGLTPLTGASASSLPGIAGFDEKQLVSLYSCES